MSDPIYTEADLSPERQLKHIKNLQKQVETLFELFTRLSEHVLEMEKREKEKEEVPA